MPKIDITELLEAIIAEAKECERTFNSNGEARNIERLAQDALDIVRADNQGD